ncbi:hypothetical protein EV1_012400 [Malus domestica]
MLEFDQQVCCASSLHTTQLSAVQKTRKIGTTVRNTRRSINIAKKDYKKRRARFGTAVEEPQSFIDEALQSKLVIRKSESNGGLNSLYLDETKCTYKIKCGQISGKQGFVKIGYYVHLRSKIYSKWWMTKDRSSPPSNSGTPPGFGKIMIQEGLGRLSMLHACQSQHYDTFSEQPH